MTIIEIIELDKIELIELAKLMLQLDSSSGELTEERLKSVIESKNSHLFIAVTDDDKIAGTLTLVAFHIPTGAKYRIEDVVVDETQGKRVLEIS